MVDPDASTVEGALREAAPGEDALDLAVARSRVAAALFGDAAPIKVGRYVLIERAGEGGMGVVWSAYDPELNRAVALKLASSGDETVRARVREEGRALAKLSHPNVVPIYDVIDVEQGVFLVMELVKGKTLRAVSEPGALVRAYRQAGEGLAAAHAVGLIHRDFKPDNAILGVDGRVRVLDFGLAQDARTNSSEIAGTPRYMAPEQRDGKPLTPAVDQFALCVALRESITASHALPRWLEPILERGAAPDPAARYPSMDALLHALALDPRARWRRRAVIGGGVLAVGAIALAFTLGRANREASPCEGGPAMIAESWGTAPRSAATRHFATLTTPYAREVTPRILTTLDTYATGWVRLHRGSCEAHRRGEISSDLLDRRAGCLARRRGALSAIGELAGKTPVDALPKLAIAVGELPDLAACSDDEALVASVKPPPKQLAAEATAITELAARADVERDAGQYEAAQRDADAALARARALNYRPLIARALHTRGRISIATVAPDRGEPLFAEATTEALAAGDETLAIEAFARQAWATATSRGPEHATDGLPLIEAVLERVGDRAKFARALLHMNLSSVAMARGDRAAARETLERARVEATAVGGAGAIELTAILASLVALVDEPVQREAVAAELVAQRTKLLGPLHPLTLRARILAASMLEDPTAARSQLWPACVELAKQYPDVGAVIGECASEVALLALATNDQTLVRSAAQLAIAAGATGAEPALVTATRAYLSFVDGDRDGAIRALVELQAEQAKLTDWWHALYGADAAAAEAIIRVDRDGAARARATAIVGYGKIADALPAPIKARRAALMK